MYRFEYQKKNGAFYVCYYSDIKSTVDLIEKNGGKIFLIELIT